MPVPLDPERILKNLAAEKDRLLEVLNDACRWLNKQEHEGREQDRRAAWVLYKDAARNLDTHDALMVEVVSALHRLMCRWVWRSKI